MPTLDTIRTASEADLNDILASLDERHRKKLRAALEQYGRVQDIPESVWEEIRREIEEETAAALLLVIVMADDWTTDSIERQGVQARRTPDLARYGLEAGRRAMDIAATTTDTVKDRLKRKVEDQLASPSGGVGTLTQQGIDQALDETLTPDRRATIATDATTTSLTSGQRGAAQRTAGDDGAATTVDGQRVELELYWVTEQDNRTCMRCAPLHDKPESVWARVFPDGPGPAAHPNCRCSLRPVVVVSMNQEGA